MKKERLIKILVFMVSIALIFSLAAACGQDNGNGAETTTTAAETDETTTADDGTDETDETEETTTQEPDPDVDQSIVYNVVQESTYDPRNAAGLVQRQVINMLFEGLLRVNEDGELMPGVAESWDISDDGITYTFYLRDGLTWSDGQPLVAGDFEYAWKSQLAPDFESASNQTLFGVILNAQAYNAGEADVDEVGVKALDEQTLEVQLETASPFFLYTVSGVSFYPVREDVGEIEGWAMDAENLIGNGPFMAVEWIPGVEVVVNKNPNYYDSEKVRLDEITIVFVPEATTSLAAFTTGDIDVIDNIPSTEVANLIEAGLAEVSPLLATYYFSINMGERMDESVREALWNKDVRHALNLAIDRAAITDVVLRGGQVPAYGFAPEGIFDLDGNDFRVGREYFPAEGDIARAQELMEQAGYPDGEGFPEIEIFYNTDEMHKLVSEAVQDMWLTHLGVRVNLVNKETAVFAEERAQGLHQIARSGNTVSATHPSILELFTPENLDSINDPKWIDDDYIALIRQAQQATEVNEAFEYYRQAEDMLMEEMVVLPIFFYTRVTAVQEDLNGVYRSSTGGIYFDRAYRG